MNSCCAELFESGMCQEPGSGGACSHAAQPALKVTSRRPLARTPTSRASTLSCAVHRTPTGQPSSTGGPASNRRRCSAGEGAGMDLAVRQLAEKQHGLFTTEQVHLVGSSRKAVRHALAAHEIIRLTRGLYVLADHYPSTTVERHLQLARGALLLVPDGVLSHWTALLAHGIPVVTVPPEVRLRRPVSSEVRRKGQVRRAGIVIDAGADDAVRASPHGPTVAISTALLQHAKSRGVEEGLASADAAVRAALVPRRELVEKAAADVGPHSRRGRRGRRAC